MASADPTLSLRRSNRRLQEGMAAKSVANSKQLLHANRSSNTESSWGSDKEDTDSPNDVTHSEISELDVLEVEVRTSSSLTNGSNNLEQISEGSVLSLSSSNVSNNPDNHSGMCSPNNTAARPALPLNELADPIQSAIPVIHIKGINGSNILTNPCKVFAALRKFEPRLGAHQVIKDAKQGLLKIKCLDLGQAHNLAKIDRLDDLDVCTTSVFPSNSQPLTSTHSVIIFGVSLDISDSEILKDSGATKVRRLPDFKSGKNLSTNVVLTFVAQPPEIINLGFESHKASLFIPKATRCLNCQQFAGHISKFCRNETKCPNCAERHEYKNCPQLGLPATERKLSCVSCGGPHSAAFRECQAYLDATKITKIKAVDKISYAEAARKFRETPSTSLDTLPTRAINSTIGAAPYYNSVHSDTIFVSSGTLSSITIPESLMVPPRPFPSPSEPSTNCNIPRVSSVVPTNFKPSYLMYPNIPSKNLSTSRASSTNVISDILEQHLANSSKTDLLDLLLKVLLMIFSSVEAHPDAGKIHSLLDSLLERQQYDLDFPPPNST